MSLTSSPVATVICLLAMSIFGGCGGPAAPDIVDVLDESYSAVEAPSAYSLLRDYQATPAVSAPESDGGQIPNDKFIIHGHVVGGDSTPIANAIVGCWCRQWDGSQAFLGKAVADGNGHYSMDATPIRGIAHLYNHVADALYRDHESRHSDIGPPLDRQSCRVTLVAFDESDAVGWASPEFVLRSSQAELDIRLRDQSGIVAGKVVDRDGKPVADQAVRIAHLYDHMDPAVPHSSTAFPFDWTATTDQNGRFVFSRIPGRMLASVGLTNNATGHSSWANIWTTPGMNADRVKAGHYNPNPCVLSTGRHSTCLVEGTLIHVNGQPIVGATVTGGDRETTTNEEGVYKLEVPIRQYTLDFAFPKHERIRPFRRTIDGVLAFKGRPQPPLTLKESSWVSGRVVSDADGSPVPGVKVQTERELLLGISDEEGLFRVLCDSLEPNLHFVPEFLSRSEQRFHEQHFPVRKLMATADAGNHQELGDIRMPMNGLDEEARVRVVLPDGQPAPQASVAVWSLNTKYPTASVQNQLIDRDGQRAYHAITDSDGVCALRSAMNYGVPQFAVVAYPSVDPLYFGELRLTDEMTGDESTTQELRLVAGRTVSGLVTFNGKPAQAMRIIAEQSVSDDRQNEPGHSADNARWQFLKFEAASDAHGRYTMQVPFAAGFSIDLQDEARLPGVRRGLACNLPVVLPSIDFPLPADGQINGPTISLFQGDGVVRGKVLGRNGKPFYTDVHLDMPPGSAVLNLFCRERRSDESGRYRGGLEFSGKFELIGVPDGQWQAFGSVSYPMREMAGNQAPKDSGVVPVTAGDEDIVIRLDRHSR